MMRFAYRILSLLSGARALQRGRYPQYLIRRTAHRQLAREMRRWFR
jgi:hypothetical protein